MPRWAERLLTFVLCVATAWVATFWPEVWSALILVSGLSIICLVAAYEARSSNQEIQDAGLTVRLQDDSASAS